MDLIEKTHRHLPQYRLEQIQAVTSLLGDGNTIPFIARYRKEQTGGLDELAIQAIAEGYDYIDKMETRKEEILRLIDEQGKLTDDLKSKIETATKLQELEDLYRPYKQKRETLAQKARKQGLEPLAQRVLNFDHTLNYPQDGEDFMNEDLPDLEAVWSGVHEILAEVIGDRADIRKWLRSEAMRFGSLKSECIDKAKDERQVYQTYYDFEQKVSKLASHQILALNRAEKEKVIRVNLIWDEEKVERYLQRASFGEESIGQTIRRLMTEAYQDAFKRFLAPSIERELRAELTEKAEDQAIEVFGENLKNLLMQAPLKNKVVLGFDPAFRTGCKLAVVDGQGKMLTTTVIYPHNNSDQKREESKKTMDRLIKQFGVDIIAVGNGTASRESERFVSEVLEKHPQTLYLIVDESGASVYSASKVAREEFPELPVEMRSAISIARRIQDPLAELVKIDPKSVGVGQYQHDLPPKKLDEKLSFIVEMVVNQVGVDVNTASVSLLTYVSGLNKTSAKNLVAYREEHGTIKSRAELKKVKRFGPKTFEQSAGFLRVYEGKNILDGTAVHPESYKQASKILKAYDIQTSEELEKLKDVKVEEVRAILPEESTQSLRDLLDSLRKYGHDIRSEQKGPKLRTDVLDIEDLKEGMVLEGTVRNVVDFGAFVDLGVGEDGLIHISQISDQYVKHPSDFLSVGDLVTVTVIELDLQRKRIGLSMRKQCEK